MGTKKTTVPVTDLDKLERATAAAREATREAREAYQDLRGCMREFEELIDQRASDLIGSKMKQGMEIVTRSINQNTDSAIRSTIGRFEECTELLNSILETVSNSKIIESLISLMQLTQVNDIEALVLIRAMRIAGEGARRKMNESETRTILNGVPIATRFPGKE